MQNIRLSWYKQDRLIEHFVAGATGQSAASLVGVNKTTVAYYFHRLREIIAEEESNEGKLFGEFEVDENYFGGNASANEGVQPPGKSLFLEFSKGAVRYPRR